MRMDIFNSLYFDNKVNAIEQFVRVYGVDDVLSATEPLCELMRGFDCAIDEHGNISPPGDVYTLEDLADEIVMSYPEADKVHGVSIVTTRTAFEDAMDSAMVEYSKERRPSINYLHKLSRWCEDEGIYFLDDGCVVWLDK